ncbi:raffinose/stachyose/melibiose transport system substrate-binding protein [Anaerotaenia torta]|uniref:ABC transporter substrate-binding protein n=1 Tax=Anaerotaenia torta TaxID=433293 RepID=UPI003D22869B
MKKLLALLLVLALAMSMVGCAAKEPKKVTLNVTTTYAGNDGNAQNFQDAIAAWQTETGNKVNDSSATSDETFKARILADFETGSEPDVLFFFNGVDSNPFVQAGKVVSVDTIRKEYPDYAKNMKDGMLGASPVDGKNYSVPVNGYWEGMFVNKEVCKAAGVEIPGPNTTWDEFMTICQKIKDAGYAPIAASLATVPHYWFEFTIYNHLTPATHNILPGSVDDEHGKAWVSGLQDIKDLYDKGFFPENTLSGTDDETVQMFIDNKAAFLIDGSWKVGGIESLTTNIDNFTVTYVPGKNNRKATDIIGGLSSGYYITKKAWDDPDKRAAAVSFVTYMTTDEQVSKFAQVSATALKNGSKVDESKLSSLAKDGLKLVQGATGMAGAVQDQIPAENRVPIFDGMPNLVTGKSDIKAAVDEVITSLKK